MKKHLVIAALAFLPFTSFPQQTNTLISKSPDLSAKADSAGKPVSNKDYYAFDTTAPITLYSYFTLLGSNFKEAFAKPFHLGKKDWGNVGKFALIESVFAFADEPIQRNVAPIKTNNAGISKVSKFITDFGGPYEAITLGAFGAYGLVFKDEKMKNTTLLATHAYITSAVLTGILKYVTGRTWPSFYNANDDAEPQFLGPFPKTVNGVKGRDLYSSFPSGHATVAFAAATVFASEYRDKPWVPIVAYGSATLVGLSRITENKHWATDVVAGAAIGFLAGKNAVLNYHRYAKKENSAQRKKLSVSFNLQYNSGHMEPGLSCIF